MKDRRPRKSSRYSRRKLYAILGIAVVAVFGIVTSAQAVTNPDAEADIGAAGPTVPGPFDDSFYLPPEQIPAGEPGDIVRFRPSVPVLNGANADAWEVMYLSTNALGEPNVVTGTVLTPKGADTTKAPIVGYAVGTQGPAFKCAASKAIERGTLYDQPAINDSISAGYAVAVTDYEGYSAETTPTYMTGPAMGPAVIDSVRAAQNLADTKLSPDAKVVFQGYSQGGGAAMWAAETQPSYAPELNLVGVAAGGVPADLTEVAKGLDGYIGFGFLAFAAIGLDTAYPELDLDKYLNETGRAELADARDNACVVELLANYPFKKISDYTTSNPLEQPDWQARLAENTLGAHPPRVPVFQYHAATDEIVNTPQAEELRKKYCDSGVQETWSTYVSDHLSGIFAGNNDARQFISDRIEGKPATSNC